MGISQSNPSSSTVEKKFEVFLSFRGETRYAFTNNLYAALRDKSIETFMDDRLEKGEEIGPNLLKTIRDSKISVVIFSKDYTSSKWCLRELVEIMECRKKDGQTVIPVFYNVAVSDVRHQEGSFKDGFDQLRKKFEEKLAKDKAASIDSTDVIKRSFFKRKKKSKQSDSCTASFDECEKDFHQEMQKWRTALTEASYLTGWDSSATRPESKLIGELVKYISKKLMCEYMPLPHDFKGLFGFEERFRKVMSLLCLDNADIRIIGIWGMGGIGKTTIADALFHQISDDDYGKCFIRNFRQRLEQCGGLINVLQQEVLSKVLKDRNIELDSLTLPKYIKERLCKKKVFIVLDDVDKFLKLQTLAGGLDRLGPGSRIVITTRNRDILKNCGVNDDYIYEVKGLSDQEALKLFCKYAFGQSPPTKDLLALSRAILHAIDGNPLGLIVAGSSLLGSNKQEWESALCTLKKSSEILEVLQISYNGLEDKDKHTFLDIACFYVGAHRDYILEILDNCSYSLKVLSDRSLITISKSKIQMHDLLQEMGKEIVCKESLNPGNRSRLWTQEDVLDTLKNDEGTNAIRGIFLNMSGMNEENLSSQAFKKMKNLRFLKIYDSTFYEFKYDSTFEVYSSKVHFPDDLNYLSDKLRSLHWLGYPLKALPSTFIPKNLVELNMRYSKLEKLWEGTMHVPNLKWIILKTCPYLKVLDLLDTPLLEKIDIKFCRSLVGFSSRFQHFQNLRELNLEYCENFMSFPSNNHFPSLTYLHFSWCIKLTRISDLLDAPSLKKVDLYNCKSLLNFPSPVQHFNNLRELNMRNCENLQSFPNNIPFPSLVSLDLYGCHSLIEFSYVLDAPLLQNINLENCSSLLDFSSPIDQSFNSLHELNMRNCENLQSFPNNIHFPSLVCLDLYGCHSLIEFSDFLDAPLLEKINLENCSSLLAFSSPIDQSFNSLRELNMRDCKKLQCFAKNIHFPSLISLDLYGCHSLLEFSDFLDAPLLENINLENCSSLLYFPSPFQHFNNLCNLNLCDCKNLRSFPSNNIHFPSLTRLDFPGCINLSKFPQISGNIKCLCMRETVIDEVPSTIENLTRLVELDLAECTRLKHISINICKLKALRKLNLRNCSALECFPEILDTMGSLTILDLSGTAIKELHHSIKNLSGLWELCLRDCKNLEMLPCSIYNLTSLDLLNLSGCLKLENLLGNSVTLSNCGEYPICRLSQCHVCFTNCLNLNNTAVSNIMELKINQHRDMKTKGYGSQAVNLKFCYPGSELPGWFKHRGDGSQIIIQIPGHDHVNGQLIGLAACAVIEFDNCNFKGLAVNYCCRCHSENYGSCLIIPITVGSNDKTLIDSDHVVLWYCDALVCKLWENQCTNYSFDFFLSMTSPTCRVKYCGVCPIYEKHNT